MLSTASKAFWRSKSTTVIVIAGTVLGIAYPFAVYFTRGAISARGFVLLALGLLALRALTARSDTARLWRMPLLLTALILVATTLIDVDIAEKAYPALMSLAVALAFTWSLYYPPSLIERLARLRRGALPPAAISYCRKVTIVWVLWLLLNAAISAGLAVWGSIAAWTLWTGLLSYLAMGLLFLSELAVRYLVLGYRPAP